MTQGKGCGLEGRTDVGGDGGGKLELGRAMNRAGEDERRVGLQRHPARGPRPHLLANAILALRGLLF